VVDAEVPAWRVHDTGLVAVPTRFRRLGGLVRHLRGQGEPWPEAVTLTLADAELRVTGPGGAPVGTWPLADVSVTQVSDGPPRSFVLDLPEGSQLLAAASGPATDALLVRLREQGRA
jgi:hypothetical protein